MVALRGKFKESPKLLGLIFWAPWISVPNVIAIHQIVVEIFQSRPKWWPADYRGKALPWLRLLIALGINYYKMIQNVIVKSTLQCMPQISLKLNE